MQTPIVDLEQLGSEVLGKKLISISRARRGMKLTFEGGSVVIFPYSEGECDFEIIKE